MLKKAEKIYAQEGKGEKISSINVQKKKPNLASLKRPTLLMAHP